MPRSQLLLFQVHPGPSLSVCQSLTNVSLGLQQYNYDMITRHLFIDKVKHLGSICQFLLGTVAPVVLSASSPMGPSCATPSCNSHLGHTNKNDDIMSFMTCHNINMPQSLKVATAVTAFSSVSEQGQETKLAFHVSVGVC